ILLILIVGCKKENSENIEMKNNLEIKDDGYFISKHNNGMLKEKGLVKEGERIGYWKKYDDNGKVVELTLYENDSIVFSTQKTKDYLFAYIDIGDTGVKYAVPKDWK